ncbi:hypothetical protein DL93DRAFT_2083967 [Clavulina sp. PMI_390]|nr:hypothetical protein DL93DRAFT_2083967 [Clavulina sp. PMI_390]
MAHQQYLAAKYMSGPKADAILAKSTLHPPKKKSKSKTKPSSASASALLLRDDDPSWSGPALENNEEDEDTVVMNGAVVVASDRSFKKRQDPHDGSGWATVRQPTPPADEQPLVVNQSDQPKGGILGKEDLARMRGPVNQSRPSDTKQEETVYRDSSGRKIDTKAEKAAAAREKRLEEEREAQKMEWGKGLVQRQEQQHRLRELELEKTRDVARYADDVELNSIQKQESRWNDPAASFLSNPKTKTPRKPEYSGPPPPPNRYGIKPGYRWDGVDRSNGFESKLFQRSNERSRSDLEGYQWRSEDM